MEQFGFVMEGISLKELTGILLWKLWKSAGHNTAPMSTELIQHLDDMFVSALSIIRRFRNSRQPSLSLPPEILAIIFEHVPEGPNPHLNVDDTMWLSSYQNTSELIPLTHVCHQWRIVALSTPSLWRSVHDRSSLASVAIERSKGMSLNLVITRDPRPYHVIHSLVNSYESPIHELHWICDEDHDPHGTISHLRLNFRAPRLEFLTLRDHSTSDFESFGPILFQGHTPQLQYLSLSCSQWFPSNEFPSLTHLSLSKIHGSDPNIILRATLSLLSRTPHLRDLVLGDIVYQDWNETRIIPLMFLTRITFKSMKHESISVLLRHLDISPDIAMQVFTSHATNPSDLASLSNHFSGRLTTLQFASVDSKTQSKASISTGMRNMINDCSFVVSAAGSSSALRYNVRGGMVDGLMVWYDRLFNNLPKHDIRELWIRTPWIGGPGWVLPGGASRMKSWSGLETLVVFDCSLHTLLVFLSSVRGICVNLSTLRLIWTSCGAGLDLCVGQNILTEFELRGQNCRAMALVVEAHVGECHAVRHAPEEVEAVFEDVEYRFFEEVPTMAFPDVCNTGWSPKFPAW